MTSARLGGFSYCRYLAGPEDGLLAISGYDGRCKRNEISITSIVWLMRFFYGPANEVPEPGPWRNDCDTLVATKACAALGYDSISRNQSGPKTHSVIATVH